MIHGGQEERSGRGGLRLLWPLARIPQARLADLIGVNDILASDSIGQGRMVNER